LAKPRESDLLQERSSEQPDFEWSLVGAQLFSTKKNAASKSPKQRTPNGDYLDVSIRGMAHDFANFSNYHQFEQLIMDRHLSKNYLIQLAAGRPHLDKGDGFDLAHPHPSEKKVPEKQIDEGKARGHRCC
jgi:hypothetical protein